MTTTFTYSSTDFPDGVNKDELHYTIDANPSIEKTLISVTTHADTDEIIVTFAEDLTQDEETALSAEVSAHDPDPVVYTVKDYAENLDEITISSDGWQNAVELSLLSDGGSYIVIWSAEVKSTSIGGKVRCMLNADVLLSESHYNRIEYMPFSGELRLNIPKGDNTIYLDWRAMGKVVGKSKGGQASIRLASIRVERY